MGDSIKTVFSMISRSPGSVNVVDDFIDFEKKVTFCEVI